MVTVPDEVVTLPLSINNPVEVEIVNVVFPVDEAIGAPDIYSVDVVVAVTLFVVVPIVNALRYDPYKFLIAEDDVVESVKRYGATSNAR